MIGNWPLAVSALSGMAAGLGLLLVALGWKPAPERLSTVFDRLDGVTIAEPVGTGAGGRPRAWAAANLPLLPGTRGRLRLRGISAVEHYGTKLVGAAAGALVPGVAGAVSSLTLGFAPWIPVGAAFVGAVAGFVLPDLLVASTASEQREDAAAALMTFLDLVTLERLANQSATQALNAAASMSDAPLFRRIREALERARLEQRPPYADLTRLAAELDLPELADVASVMRLDETGAALATALRARAAELRNAHLTRAKVAAHARAERLTVLMVVPSLIFALIFLTPPLLRLLGQG